MAQVFPGLVPFDVDEALLFYLRPGGAQNAYELFGYPDPVARSLAEARLAPTASKLSGLTFVGLYSGILAFERELTALGGCARAIGEWSAASRVGGSTSGTSSISAMCSWAITSALTLRAWRAQ